MAPQFYSLLHVFSIMLLSGSIFYIAANPQKHKKTKMMIITGVLGLVAFVASMGLIGKLGYSFTDPWILVKFVIWLFLMALAGMAYKKPKGFVIPALIVSIGIALFMVYYRPF